MSFPGRAVQRAWYLVDASSQTVGRLAASVAPLLKGKHKPTYRPNGKFCYFTVKNISALISILTRTICLF
jgi:ribosomal protein L13